MYRTFESIKNWQRYKCLKIFVIPGGNTPPTKFSRGDTSATLPNLNGRYQGATCTSWINFYMRCKSQPISLPYYTTIGGLSPESVFTLPSSHFPLQNLTENLPARSQFYSDHRVLFSMDTSCQSATFGPLTFCVCPLLLRQKSSKKHKYGESISIGVID